MGNKVTSACHKKKYEGRQLFVFDFDQTIVMRNCETIYKELVATRRDVSPSDKQLNLEVNWDNISQELINYTINQGVSIPQILQAVRNLTFVPGIDRFLQCVSKYIKKVRQDSQLLILSAANDLYIDTKLTSMNPPVQPTSIIANHAYITDDYKRIIYQFHDDAIPCDVCKNALCKGYAIQAYLDDHGPFDVVHYIGDGTNDVCPAIRLRPQDYLYVRAGYGLDLAIHHGLSQGQYIVRILAKIYYWNTGFDLIRQTKQFI